MWCIWSFVTIEKWSSSFNVLVSERTENLSFNNFSIFSRKQHSTLPIGSLNFYLAPLLDTNIEIEEWNEKKKISRQNSKINITVIFFFQSHCYFKFKKTKQKMMQTKKNNQLCKFQIKIINFQFKLTKHFQTFCFFQSIHLLIRMWIQFDWEENMLNCLLLELKMENWNCPI